MSKNVLYAVAQIVAGAVLTFLLFAWTTRVSGLETIGLWGLVLGLGSVTRFSELGLGAAAVRFVALAKVDGDTSWTATVIGTTVVTVSAFASVAAALLLTGTYLMDSSLQQIAAYRSLDGFIGYTIAALALASVATIVSSCLDGLERFDLRVLSVISGQLGLTMFGLIFVEQLGVKALVFGLLVQAIVTIVLGCLFIRLSLRLNILNFVRFNISAFKSLIGYGVKIAGSSALILFFEPFTKFMLLQAGGLSTVGAFEIANQVVQKFRSVLSGALQVLTPRFAALSSHDGKSIILNDLVGNAYKLLIPILFFGFCSLFLSSYTVAAVLAPGERQLVALIMQVLCFCWLVNTASLPIYFFNIGSGNAGKNLQCFGLMTVVNISLTYLFVEYLDQMGVLLAYGISLTFGGIFLILSYLRAFGVGTSSVTRGSSYLKVSFIGVLYFLFYGLRPNLDADIAILALYSGVTIGLSFALLFISKSIRAFSCPALSKVFGFSVK